MKFRKLVYQISEAVQVEQDIGLIGNTDGAVYFILLFQTYF
jgi:hypothetical protein